MRSRIVWIVLLVLGLALAAAFALAGPDRTSGARVELKVEKLTCGACAQKIRQALAELPGVGEVEVDVRAGRVTVGFDPQQVAPAAIAEKVTAAGYPATLQETRAESAAEAAEAERLVGQYVGRIGERLVSRDEFTAEIDGLRAAGGPRFTEAQLRRIAWQQLVQKHQPPGGAPLPVQVFDPFLRPAQPAGSGGGCSCCG